MSAALRDPPVYLDYAATAPLDARVAATMADCLSDPALQANPASAHAAGRLAAPRVEQARAEVAALVNAPPESIVFTSGALWRNPSINAALWYGVGREGCGLATFPSAGESGFLASR